MAQQLTDAVFEQEVIKSDLPVLIDFWAEWCGPCRMIGPIVDELATEYEGKVKVFKMNVDENTEVPTKYGVRNIPTLLFFKGGDVADKQVGVAPKTALSAKLDALL